MSNVMNPSQISARMREYNIPYAIVFDGVDDVLSRIISTVGDLNTHTLVWYEWRWAGNADFGRFTAGINCQNYYTAANVATFSDAGGTLVSEAVHRDFGGAWVACQLVHETGHATPSERKRYYENGVRITAFTTETQPAQFANTAWNSAIEHNIGRTQHAASQYLKSGIAEVYFIGGLALPQTDFMKFDLITGKWRPKAYKGNYGVNGCHLDFSDANNLGRDANIPINEYAHPNTNYPVALSGAVTYVGRYGIQSAALSWFGSMTHFSLPATGTIYVEAYPSVTTGGNPCITLGVGAHGLNLTSEHRTLAGFWGLNIQGAWYHVINGTPSTMSAGGAGITPSQRAQLFIKCETGEVWFGIDDVWYDTATTTNGNPSAGTNPSAIIPNIEGMGIVLGNYGTITNTLAVEEADWTFTPPTGGISMSTANIDFHARWNPLVSVNSSPLLYSDANKTITRSGNDTAISALRVANRGRYWVEGYVVAVGSGVRFGIGTAGSNVATGVGDYALYSSTGEKELSNVFTAYGAAYTTGDVIGLDINRDTGELTCYKQTAGTGAFVSQGVLDTAMGTGDIYVLGYMNLSASLTLRSAVIELGNDTLPVGATTFTTDGIPLRGNDWTVVGTPKQITSTPTDRGALLNPLVPTTGITYENGNLRATVSAVRQHLHATLNLPSNKITRWEITVDAARSTYTTFGISTKGEQITSGASYHMPLNVYGFSDNGPTWGKVENGSTTGTFAYPADRLHFNLEFDGPNGTLKYFAGDVLVDTITGLTGEYIPYFGIETPVVMDVIFDKADWVFTPSLGATPLSTKNLPKLTDSIHNHCGILPYTGNGTALASGGLSITGLPFQPDFAWLKGRSVAYSHGLFDRLRGPQKTVYTDLTSGETTGTERLASFDPSGITLGNEATWNQAAATFMALCASLPKTAASWGFGETITPTGEIYNDSAMFKMSIVTYVGTGAAGAKIPHSLDVKPGLITIRALSTPGTWWTYHQSLGAGYSLELDTTAAAVANTNYLNNTEPTDQLITLGGTGHGINDLGVTYIAYVFAPCDGIKFVKYKGNGSANGPMLNVGVSPIFELFKIIDGIDSWAMYDHKRDPNNVSSHRLVAESVDAEATNSGLDHDMTSMGPKLLGVSGSFNANGYTYIGMIIGEPESQVPNPAR